MRGIFFAFLYLLGYDFCMMKYIDAHCHILDVARMRDAAACGVDGFIVNATDTSNWATVIEIAQRDNVYGAIGVYSLCVSNLPDNWDEQLMENLKANPELMVGEIGLDKRHPDIEAQDSVFRRQLQIAHDMGRVAHIHCVGAWGKVMDILRTNELPSAMVFHAFSGAPELVRELTNMGIYFSFGPDVCNTQYARMRAAVTTVPESRILAESDTPHRLSPDSVPNTVAEIAKLRGVDVEQMAETIYNNTLRLLNGRKI